MPQRTPEQAARHRDYMRRYMQERYWKRRALAFEILGDHCIQCGSTQDLHVDHIDPSTKSYSFEAMYPLKESTFRAELEKCQTLCKECHRVKTNAERRQAYINEYLQCIAQSSTTGSPPAPWE